MVKTRSILYTLLFCTILYSCNKLSGEERTEDGENIKESTNEVNIYTHRHYESDQKLFDQFTEGTGIKVNVVSASADELIKKLELEGEKSPADILIAVDAGRLHRAKEKNLLQPVNSSVLNKNIPAKFRDPEGYWFGLTYRARVIVYARDRIKEDQLTTYVALTDKKWDDKILVRSSDNIYNQSLLASIIANKGEEEAKKWAQGIVENMARTPKGNDRDQVKAVASGEGDIAIVNTYYIGKLLNSDNQEEVKAGQAVKVFFPNQKDRGTHINISGAGVTAHAPHKANAVKFLEFLSDNEAQEVFAKSNFEYPVKEGVAKSELLQSWGDFKADDINLSLLGEHNKEAVIIFDEVGWK